MYLWPGLPQLWRRGSWIALAWALGFAALVDGCLIANLLWTELLPDALRQASLAAVAAVWLGWLAIGRLHQRAAGTMTPTDDSYRQLIGHYLQGNWFEAECVLARLLHQDPRDVDAGLMLATLYRHTGRFKEAAQQLDRLQRFDEAVKWALEIERERARLASAQHPAAENRSPPAPEQSDQPSTQALSNSNGD